MRHSLAFAFALSCLALLPAVVRGDEEPLDAETLVQRLLTTSYAEEAKEIIDDVVDLGPDASNVDGWLRQGPAYASDVRTGWLAETNLCTDGVERNYLLFVPEDYTPEKKYRLVVDMHGGVSRPQQLSHAQLDQMKFFWGDHARAHGYLLALPAGQAGAEWWSPVGVRHVLDIVRTVKRVYNVDDDRVFATGFSDGGSGSFYMALTNPTAFAGFIPLNGHLAVTQAKGLQVHLANLRNRPLYVVNTEKDSLYPAASVGPIVEAMAPLGIDVLWHSIPDFTHNPMYMATERPVIAAWMNATVRKPRPPRVTWQGTADAAGRVDWLEVTAVSSEGADGAFPDPNPTLPAGRVRIGVNVDQAFEGPGVKVSGITDDSPASAMGVVAGDVIVGLDDAEIQGMRELRTALGGKSFGDAFVLRLRRGDEVVVLEGSFPEAAPRAVFERGKPWGAIQAVEDGSEIDVQARGVTGFALYLSLAQASNDDLVVTLNDQEVHRGPVAPDLRFMLTRAVADRDRSKVYAARLLLEVPTGD